MAVTIASFIIDPFSDSSDSKSDGCVRLGLARARLEMICHDESKMPDRNPSVVYRGTGHTLFRQMGLGDPGFG